MMRWIGLGVLLILGCGADVPPNGNNAEQPTGDSNGFEESRLAIDGPAIDAVREWLKENLDTPVWQEIRWYEPIGDYLRIKVRTISPTGNLVLRDLVFVLYDGGPLYLAEEEAKDFFEFRNGSPTGELMNDLSSGDWITPRDPKDTEPLEPKF